MIGTGDWSCGIFRALERVAGHVASDGGVSVCLTSAEPDGSLDASDASDESVMFPVVVDGSWSSLIPSLKTIG